MTQLSIAQIAPTIENFEDVENLPGWEFSNQSEPLGDSNWFEGTAFIFTDQGSGSTQYIAANHRNTSSVADSQSVICNYLIMPDLGNLESVSFYSRSSLALNNFNVYPDRLYMVYSPTGSTNTGNCTDDFGDFTETLLVINPDLTEDGYPLASWQQYSSDVNGPGRVAFVYYVDDAGFSGTNSNFIGIDTVEWVLGANVPTPSQDIKCISTSGNGCQTVKFKTKLNTSVSNSQVSDDMLNLELEN